MAMFRSSLITAAISARLCMKLTTRTSPGLSRTVFQATNKVRTLDHQLQASERGRENTMIQDDSSKNWAIDPHTGRPRVGGNWNYNLELIALAERLGYKLNELPSLRPALHERGLLGSVPARSGNPGMEVSCLSVFGRTTMMYYVTEYLYFAYPNLEGSMLTDLCDFLTNDNAISELANYVGVTALIRTRKLLTEPKRISNAFCAVIGALCRDIGGKAARRFVHDFIITQLAGKDLHDLIKLQHPRFMLHAILKSQKLPKPESRLIKETGRATHFPSFVVGVYSEQTLLGEGCGTSLKRAEREAMLAALRTRFQKEMSEFPLPSDHDEFEREEEFVVMSNLTEEQNT